MDPKNLPRGYLGHLPDRHHQQEMYHSAPAMVNSSELALRVALCDLVERLKRSEQTCKYLEQCRNELAREVIKLKQENMLISRENSLGSAILHNELLLSRAKYVAATTDSDYLVASKYGKPGGSLGRHEDELVEDKQTHALSELEMLKNNSSSDESWEKITDRLLKQLREEMQQSAATESPASAPQPGPSSADDAGSESSPVYLTPPPPPPASDTRTSTLRSDSEAYETQTTQMAISGDQTLDVTSAEQYASFQIQENKNQLKSVVVTISDSKQSTANNNRIPKSEQSSPAVVKDEPNISGLHRDDASQQTIDLCEKVMAALTSDFDIMGRRIQQQNEKLTKLKNKQLRRYFRRQLNDDIVISSGSKATAHLEHV